MQVVLPLQINFLYGAVFGSPVYNQGMEKTRTIITLLAVCLAIIASPVWAEDAPGNQSIDGYKITKVTVKRYNVFDLDNPDEQGFIPRVANSIHVVTKEKVIRDELLFKEGDSFGAEVIEESERNLRKYKMFQKVLITPQPDHNNKSVEVLVETWDQWSLVIGGSFGGTSGKAKAGVDIGDLNLLGTGQLVKYTMRKSSSNTAHSFGYRDRTFLSSHYLMDADYSTDDTEQRWNGVLTLPFYSVDTPFSHGLRFIKIDHKETGLEYHNYVAEYSAAFGFPVGEHVIRLGGGASGGEQYVVDPVLGRQPTTRDNKLFLTMSLLFNPRDYIEVRYLEKFRVVEDIPLGAKIDLKGGRAFRQAGASSNRESFSATISKYFQPFTKDLAYVTANIRKWDSNFSEEYLYGNFRYYWRDFENSTIVLNLEGGYADSATERFIIGGTNGVRGYEADSFTGNRLMMGNLEYRYFYKEPMMWNIFEPGFVLFADGASIWNRGDRGEPQTFHGSFGVGIRIAFLKAPGISLLRVDYGVPSDNMKKPVITIGMEGFF